MVFADLSLGSYLLRAVNDEGYSTPTPIQEAAIPAVLSGQDVLASAQTGTGKTAAFALPILHRLTEEPAAGHKGRNPIRVLVLSPTRELATQIDESFRVYGKYTKVRRTTIYGGVSQIPQVRDLRRGVDVVVATPGRLMDLIQQGHIRLHEVETLVLDEADRMLDMGFLPDIRRIIERLPVERQTLLFSATFPPAIEQLANSILRLPVRIKMAPTQPTIERIEQSVCFVAKPDKRDALSAFLASQAIERAIVFTRTKHGADRLVRHLMKTGVRAEAMHGDKSQAARQKTLNNFKSQRPPILVATDVAARGIDVDGVTHVINFDLPHEPETYVHRIGRTGRAGAGGTAVSFCDHEERGHLRAIERLIRRQIQVQHIPVTDLPQPRQATQPETRPTDRPQAERTPRPPQPRHDRPHGAQNAAPERRKVQGGPRKFGKRFQGKKRRPHASGSRH